MASNLSCIGFTFANAEEFQRAMLDLAPRCIERVGCTAGDYSIWRSRTGAELWFHLATFGSEDDERDIAGLTPFYEGFSEVTLEVTARVARPDDNPFEGAFHAWVLDETGAQAYPLTFDAVDFAANEHLKTPFRASARITGFARELRAFADEAAYSRTSANDTQRIPLAARAFVPIGQFAEIDESDDETPPSSTALLTGRVREHTIHTNEASGREFHWLLVDSFEATFDIVADPEIVSGEIAVGGTVEIACVLIGRLLDSDASGQ